MKFEITSKKVNTIQLEITRWGEIHFSKFPWRDTDNLWHALVAEIMLQRTNAHQVIPAYLKFIENYESPYSYLSDQSSNVFENLGLRWREKVLKNLAIELTNLGFIPEEKQELLNLPGVGDYIAAAYRSLHLNNPDTIIDSNVVRLYGRLFGFKTTPETRRKQLFKELAERMTPDSDHRLYNYGMIDLTREICKYKPDCKVCPLQSECKYYKTQMTN
ncbi:hypothetical protein [Bacillus sp. Cs-700]|uniref:hypothetical protein n=1 Tax=Bacillus sp. Cs-700 TaxID=2589818 RepID=UPI00140B7C29|nr:hypothetical protein [Bacillus sp. Cs-700]